MEQAFGVSAVLLASGGTQTGNWVPVEDAISTQVQLEADALAAGDVFIEQTREKTGTPVVTLQTWTIVAVVGGQTAPYELGRLIGFIRVRTALSAGNVGAYFNKLVS